MPPRANVPPVPPRADAPPKANTPSGPGAPGLPSPSLKHRLEAAGVAVARALFRALPMDAASALGGRLWRWIAPLTPRHERALTHLQMAFPDMGDAERRAIAAAMWDNLGRVFAETFVLDRLAADPSRLIIGDMAPAERIAASGRGGVVVSLHMANWELSAQALVRLGLKPTGMYQQLRNPLVEATVRVLRENVFPGGLFGKGGDGGADTAMRVVGIVRRGGCLGILGDLREPTGPAVPFFGIPAHATPFPALVARSLGVPLVAARMRRLDGARFRIDAVEIEVPRTRDRKADVAAATAGLHRAFETWIRETPEQWFWIHRKWAPPGNKDAPR